MLDKDEELPIGPHTPCICAPFFTIQEWTGTQWAIVDDTRSGGRVARPLYPATTPGRYVGERVRTPCG
jgi:hypothetical protein